MTNLEKLDELCKKLAADGVVDIKFTLANRNTATAEEAAGEVLRMYAAYECGESEIVFADATGLKPVQ